jgi:hypothetical protein
MPITKTVRRVTVSAIAWVALAVVVALSALTAIPAMASEVPDVEPIDLEALLGAPDAEPAAAGQSCSAYWDCRWGADISCSCPGTGTCSSSPGASGFGEVSCTCGDGPVYYLHEECFDPT